MGISTHVLETSAGQPAAGVGVVLAVWQDVGWVRLQRLTTDQDGRCKELLPEGAELKHGRYQVHFETADFYAVKGERCLYPYVEIVFEVWDERHHHIPLLLTANGYTTYRGS